MTIYQKRKNKYPSFLRNAHIGHIKPRAIRKNFSPSLDDFIGRYKALDAIDSVDLKHKFKNEEI